MGLKHRTPVVNDVLPMTLNAPVRLSRHFWRYKASYNWAYIAVDGHKLLLKISGQILLRVPLDISTIFLVK